MGWIRRSGTLLAGVVLATVAAPAHAGTYTVYGCKTPNGTPAPTEGWGPADANTSAAVRDAEPCAAGKAVRVELNAGVDHAQGAFVDYAFSAPAGLPIVGYVLYRSVHVGAGTAPEQYNYDLLEDGQVSPENCRGACTRGAPSAPLSEASAYTRGDVRLGKLTFRVSCGVGSGDPLTCKQQSPPPSALALHRAEIVLEDNSDPEFTSPPAGTLFDTSRELNGVVSASFAAKDTGSGVFQAIIEVDGRPVVTAPIDDNGGKCRKPFVARVPCKAGASAAGTISLDTAILPDGPHNVRLLVQDATGTNEIPYGPFSITTRNSVPGRGTPNGANAADAALLDANWRGRSSRELRTGFGRTVTIAGKLRNPAGQPIVGAAVVISKTDLRLGAAEESFALVTTGADGAFGHRFKAGPGMSIAVRYKAFAGDPGFSAQQGLTLRVRASASFRAPRKVKRGRRLRFSGRLRGGPIPRTGKLVVLQARVGRRWEDSKTVRTDRRGRFSSSVPTRRAGGRSTVRLRVLVRREASYPYSSGGSAVRRVTLVP
jgi:hypothetical protein